jgi:hypothetical protein
MNQSKRILSDGREISLVSFFVRNLAVDLQAGISQTILDRHALSIAHRIWPGRPCEFLTNDLLDGLTSTQYSCMGEFLSGPIPGSEESASSLVVIWFQPALSSQFEERAFASLSSVNWNAKAKAFSW